jgi:DNA-binding SARP family transcriptional activator
VADPTSEPAYPLVIRTHLVEGNTTAAVRALDDCWAALADLGLEPDPATIALLPHVSQPRSTRAAQAEASATAPSPCHTACHWNGLAGRQAGDPVRPRP